MYAMLKYKKLCERHPSDQISNIVKENNEKRKTKNTMKMSIKTRACLIHFYYSYLNFFDISSFLFILSSMICLK